MELRQFKYVNMIAQCGSITKAAKKLFISQPALSSYINKLEEELGVKLFDWSATPLICTYAGEQYLKRARTILMQMDDMEREFRDIATNCRGRLRLGFPGERLIYMLPLILPPFKEKYPGIDVEVTSGPGNRLIEDLRNGDIDFVFLPQWAKEKDIAQVKVTEEELVLVTAKGYLDEEYILNMDKRIVNWKKAAQLPFITLEKGHALRASVDVLAKNSGIRPNIILESHSNMLSCRLAAKGLGVAVVPEMTLALLKDSVDLDIYHLSEHPLTWEVFALYREGCYIGEVEQALFRMASRLPEPRLSESCCSESCCPEPHKKFL